MVVSPIRSLTEFVTEQTMSIIGNSSLQHAATFPLMVSSTTTKITKNNETFVPHLCRNK